MSSSHYSVNISNCSSSSISAQLNSLQASQLKLDSKILSLSMLFEQYYSTGSDTLIESLQYKYCNFTQLAKMDWKNKPNQIFNKVKQQMYSKGIETFHYMDQHIEAFDPQHKLTLSSHFFNLFLNKAGVFLSTQEIRNIRDLYSKAEDQILYKDFLEDVKYSISQKIAGLLNQAFEVVDTENARKVDLQFLISKYDTSKHPHVITRRKSPEDVQYEFTAAISRKADKEGKVSKEGFVDYYAELNFCIPIERENYFQQLIVGTWNLVNPAEYVSPSRLKEIQFTLYEKIRQKSNGKTNEWKTAKNVLSFFDLGDTGTTDFQNFKRALDKFGCNFKSHELKALFNKYDVNHNGKLEYEEFAKMIMDLDISGMSKQPNLLTTLGTNHFKVTH